MPNSTDPSSLVNESRLVLTYSLCCSTVIFKSHMRASSLSPKPYTAKGIFTLRQNMASTKICSIEPDILFDIEPDLSSNKIKPWLLPFGVNITLRKMLSSNLYDESLLISISPVSASFDLLNALAALRISNSLASKPIYLSFLRLKSFTNSIAKPG